MNVFWFIGVVVVGDVWMVRVFGGWNECFFFYYEDKDFSICVWWGGFDVIFVGLFWWIYGWVREMMCFCLMFWVCEFDLFFWFYIFYFEFFVGGVVVWRWYLLVFE